MIILAALLLAAPTEARPGTPAACALLSATDIAEVQGTAPEALKPAERSDGEIVSQQCLFLLPKYAQSVSLEVRRPRNGAPAASLRKRWRRLTEIPTEGEAEREREKEGEHRGPRRVSGIGRQALWMGQSRAGALYVLTRRAILRISVGGAGDDDSKLNACKTLARRALARL